ncbi:MAG: TIGR02300 family protein [Alphaproteobacteria bacterium]
MAKPEWGVKRTCLACGARFYDMQKSPIVCPSCEAEFDPEAIFRPRRNRASDAGAPAPANDDAAKPAATAEDEVEALVSDVEVEDDDDDDDAALAPDLDDDENDEPVVVVKSDDDEN